MPQSLAIIAATFPREVRGRAIGVWAAASAITTALGPPLGGFLIDTFELARRLPDQPAALGRRAVADLRPCAGKPRRDGVRDRIDWTGSAIVSGLARRAHLWPYGCCRRARRAASRSSRRSALGVAGLAAFWRVEKRAANPILPATCSARAPFLVANILTLFLYGALAGVLFLLPFDLIARRGMAASAVGTTLLPFGLIIGLLSRPAGGLADRYGARELPGRRLARGGARRAPGWR